MITYYSNGGLASGMGNKKVLVGPAELKDMERTRKYVLSKKLQGRTVRRDLENVVEEVFHMVSDYYKLNPKPKYITVADFIKRVEDTPLAPPDFTEAVKRQYCDVLIPFGYGGGYIANENEFFINAYLTGAAVINYDMNKNFKSFQDMASKVTHEYMEKLRDTVRALKKGGVYDDDQYFLVIAGIINVTGHELYHARQMLVEKTDFTNYIQATSNLVGYYKQDIEADARTNGLKIMNWFLRNKIDIFFEK